MSIHPTLIKTFLAVPALAFTACGPGGPSIDDLNNRAGAPAGVAGSDTNVAGSDPGVAGSGPIFGGSGGTGSSFAGSSSGGTAPIAGSGTGGSAPVAGSSSGGTDVGVAGAAPVGGSAGSMSSMGGAPPTAGAAPMGGSPAAGAPPMGGTGGMAPAGPYAPRSGPFKVLVYSRQGPGGYRHSASITTGKAMLTQIAQEQGFENVFVESDADSNKYITPEELAKFEMVFFLNSTSDIFNATQQKSYEDWMTQKNGAFAGVHSATDTERGWAFYAEVTGQYYNGHGAAGTMDQIQLESSMLTFPALQGIPNPWRRSEEWYKFDSWQSWSTKPGFKILGKKAADGQPIMWIREYGNWRSFYTAIGHDGVVFQDADVKKHVTGGLMWAVRREHLIK